MFLPCAIFRVGGTGGGGGGGGDTGMDVWRAGRKIYWVEKRERRKGGKRMR